MQPKVYKEEESFRVVVKEIANIFAETFIDRLKPEISKHITGWSYPAPPLIQEDRSISTKSPGSLWSIDDLARDSGVTKSAWRRWIYQRKIPVVKLGRLIRIRETDYRKFVQEALRPEIKLDNR